MVRRVSALGQAFLASKDSPERHQGKARCLLRANSSLRRWDREMEGGHYPQSPQMVGEQLRHVAVLPDGTWLALLGWSSAAYHLKPRERWIGWSEGFEVSRPLSATWNISGLSDFEAFNLNLRRPFPRFPQVVVHLQTKPGFRIAAEGLLQTNCHFSRYPGMTVYQIVQGLARDAQRFGSFAYVKAQRRKALVSAVLILTLEGV